MNGVLNAAGTMNIMLKKSYPLNRGTYFPKFKSRFIRIREPKVSSETERVNVAIVRTAALAESDQYTGSLIDALKLIHGEDRGSKAEAYAS